MRVVVEEFVGLRHGCFEGRVRLSEVALSQGDHTQQRLYVVITAWKIIGAGSLRDGPASGYITGKQVRSGQPQPRF